MQVKTFELIDDALDWAVYESQGYSKNYLKFWNEGGDKRFVHCHVMSSPSKNWEQGGPIMEREGININFMQFDNPQYWTAHIRQSNNRFGSLGPTPLIAAMRCYVASKFGDTIEVPDELTQV